VPSPVTCCARPLSLPTRAQILEANLARVRARIAAAERAHAHARLIAVTKSVDLETTLALARLGVRELGENRTDRLERKALALAALPQSERPDVRWHMIGHLQRNKAQVAVEHAGAIHSIDSPRLLASLARLSSELERDLDGYLEVELTGIATRSGFAPDALGAVLDAPLVLGRLRLRGLMTMAAPDANARAGELATQGSARRTFAALRELAHSLPRERFAEGRVELSMGMSDDLEAALAEGADVVRVGSALFEGLDEPAASGGLE